MDGGTMGTPRKIHQSLTRLEAFSDGVFAIAITLLVIEIKVPHLDHASTTSELLMALLKSWPSYFGFVISFFAILVVWINHHRFFQSLIGSDCRLLLANGFLLFTVSAMPFPTAVLADYLTTPAASAACAVYAGSLVMLNLGFILVWRVAHSGGLLKEGAINRRLIFSLGLGFVVYLAAVFVAFVSPYLSLALCMVLWPYWALVER